MNNENEFFLKKMKGVKPIKKNNTILNNKTRKKNKIIKNKTKETKLISPEPKTEQSFKDSNFVLEHINIRKNIKKNVFKIDKKIDFHGKTLLEAEEIFSSTVLSCYRSGNRCLLFITGKGLFKTKNKEGNNEPKLYHGVIREAFSGWVKSKQFSKLILSFEQASIEHGGDGAFFVYLRKNKS